MATIDGEELTFVCQDCGQKFKQTIGYGPVAPTPWVRAKLLKESPPMCPHCKSNNVTQPLWSKLLGI